MVVTGPACGQEHLGLKLPQQVASLMGVSEWGRGGGVPAHQGAGPGQEVSNLGQRQEDRQQGLRLWLPSLVPTGHLGWVLLSPRAPEAGGFFGGASATAGRPLPLAPQMPASPGACSRRSV